MDNEAHRLDESKRPWLDQNRFLGLERGLPVGYSLFVQSFVFPERCGPKRWTIDSRRRVLHLPGLAVPLVVDGVTESILTEYDGRFLVLILKHH